MSREFSYIRRRGRMTKAQARGLQELQAQYAVTVEAAAAMAAQQPATESMGLEVGFGMGDALLDWARQSPSWRLLGVELYQPGIGALAGRLAKAEIDNVGIVEAPAQILLRALPAACLQQVRIFFPDPWPKKRHHKRRLVQQEFVADLARVLRPGGLLWIATDWAPYAAWIRDVLAGESKLVTASPAVARNATKFEVRGIGLGHQIEELILQRLTVA